MTANMSISVNGQSQVPPGFRFHPTEEELLHFYLRKKVSFEKIDLDVIRDVDLNKLEPWDIQERCKIGTTPQNDWYFFSHKDKKYPTGTRTNRATAAGFWKATGRDKVIHSTGKRIGMRKTLVFYKGRAPHGQKSDWIMHEYRLDDSTGDHTNVSNVMEEEAALEEGWVVCRIFKKKNLNKTLDKPLSSPSISADTRNQMLISCDEDTIDQTFHYMGRTCKEEKVSDNSARYLRPVDTAINYVHHDGFMKLPSLESPNSISSQNCYLQPMITDSEGSITNQMSCPLDPGVDNWAALDRLLAYQLNGQTETSRQSPCIDPTLTYCTPTDLHHDLRLPALRSSFPLPSNRSYHGTQDYNNEIDLWNFTTRSSPDTLCHLSDTGA